MAQRTPVDPVRLQGLSGAERGRSSPALAASLGSGPGSLGKLPQSVLRLGGKVSVDRRLAFGVTAGRLGARLLGFFDA